MNRIFYGWYVALGCGVGLACGLASVITATFPIFLGPLLGEFGWTQSQAYTAVFLTTAAATVASPFVGALVDRVGARRVILIALLLEALVIASFATQTDSIGSFYVRYVVLAILGLGTTHIAFARVISMWFDRRRGLALGVALAGVGVGGAVWPLLTQWAIDLYGWRNAYLVVAAVIVGVGMTVLALVVRDTPQSLGLTPDGDPVPAGAASAAPEPGYTLRETMRQPRFWLMLFTFVLIGASVQSIILHLVPLLKERGVEPMRAATAQSMVFVALIFGRVAAGWLMDRFFAPRVAIAFLVGPIVGVLLLAAGASGTGAFMAGILTGLAAGAEVDVTAYLASRYFGVRYFSRIYAWFYSAYSLGAGIGPLATARGVETFRGYTEVLYVHGAVLTLAALLLTALPAFPTWKK